MIKFTVIQEKTIWCLAIWQNGCFCHFKNWKVNTSFVSVSMVRGSIWEDWEDSVFAERLGPKELWELHLNRCQYPLINYLSLIVSTALPRWYEIFFLTLSKIGFWFSSTSQSIHFSRKIPALGVTTLLPRTSQISHILKNDWHWRKIGKVVQNWTKSCSNELFHHSQLQSGIIPNIHYRNKMIFFTQPHCIGLGMRHFWQPW